MQKLRKYVAAGGKLKPSGHPVPRNGRPIDPERKQRVEQAAIKMTSEYYEGLGYKVNSVESDNVSWDLEAAVGDQKLKIEVKGLSGPGAVVELTPNEYGAMTSPRHRSSYRLCIVTSALDKPKLHNFSYDSLRNVWLSDETNALNIQERTGARISIADGAGSN